MLQGMEETIEKKKEPLDGSIVPPFSDGVKLNFEFNQ